MGSAGPAPTMQPSCRHCLWLTPSWARTTCHSVVVSSASPCASPRGCLVLQLLTCVSPPPFCTCRQEAWLGRICLPSVRSTPPLQGSLGRGPCRLQLSRTPLSAWTDSSRMVSPLKHTAVPPSWSPCFCPRRPGARRPVCLHIDVRAGCSQSLAGLCKILELHLGHQLLPFQMRVQGAGLVSPTCCGCP